MWTMLAVQADIYPLLSPRQHDFIQKMWESMLRIFLSDFVASSESTKMIADQIKKVLLTHSVEIEPDVHYTSL